MRIAYAALAVVATTAAVPASAAELLVNGGFETPTVYFNTYSGTQIPGWTVTTNNVDIASNSIYGVANYAYEGSQWLDIVGTGRSGAIAQTFATTAGTTYSLSFAYANNPDFTPASASVAVTGATSLLATTIAHGGSTRTAAGWTLYTGSFVADSTSATLLFTDVSHNLNAGIYLDAVSVQSLTTGVPEPATWATMLVGLGAVGGSMRLRRKGATAAA